MLNLRRRIHKKIISKGSLMPEFDKSISVVGTCCPMPLVKVTEAVTNMQPGQVLKVTGDDPLFESGLQDFCIARGFQVLGVSVEGKATTMLIQV
ncbi:MAG: sulfurtransferase TusA family protein [Gammaproteobacteria bacterium]|nr:MAG: sulfurtransferase TusA family protein [Gammaproteobacteria bacterium]